MEVRSVAQSRLGLLTIAPELRAIILGLSVDCDQYHILDEAIVKHPFEHEASWCPNPHECHSRITTSGARSSYCRRVDTPALLITCRLLRQEAWALVQTRRAMVCGSPVTMLHFLLYQPVARHPGSQIYLACGPAKYGPEQNEHATVDTLQILSSRGEGLRELHLTFQPYYGIHDDPVILSHPIITALGRFAGLQRLTLSVTPEPPGPIGYGVLSRASLRKKVYAMQAALSLLVCDERISEIDENTASFARYLNTIAYN